MATVTTGSVHVDHVESIQTFMFIGFVSSDKFYTFPLTKMGTLFYCLQIGAVGVVIKPGPEAQAGIIFLFWAIVPDCFVFLIFCYMSICKTNEC